MEHDLLMISNWQMTIKKVQQNVPNMAELSAAHTLSRRDGDNCQPKGLDQGLLYASKLNAS